MVFIKDLKDLENGTTRVAIDIKDLKDLENGPIRVSIDIKDLKDLKRHRLTMAIAGDRPPRYGKK